MIDKQGIASNKIIVIIIITIILAKIFSFAGKTVKSCQNTYSELASDWPHAMNKTMQLFWGHKFRIECECESEKNSFVESSVELLQNTVRRYKIRVEEPCLTEV